MQTAVPEPGPSTSDRARHRTQRWLSTLVIVALVIGTAAGFLLARDRAERNAERLAEQAASRAAEALQAEVRELVSGLAGSAAVIAADGTLDTEVFSAYARDVLATEELATDELATVALVGLGPAGESRAHPIVAVEPEAPGRPELGTDFGSDPVRNAAIQTALATRQPVMTDVVDLTTTGAPGVELVRPLVDRTGDPAVLYGFVVAGIPVAHLATTARRAIGIDVDVALTHGDEVLFGPEFLPRDRTASASVDVPGPVWTVTTTIGKPDLATTWLVAAGGLAAIAAMSALLVATERHQRRLARTNVLLAESDQRSRAVQDVAGRLARALSGGDIVTALVAHLPAAVGARSAAIAVINEAGHLELLGPGDAGGTHREQVLASEYSESIVATAITSGRPAWLSSPLGWRGDDVADALAAGGSALALLPFFAEDVVGVLAVSYPRIRIFADDEQDLLQTVSLLSARALARGRQYDAEHETALAFQHAALPDELPSVEGLTIAARYLPAAQRATVGGDWYDVLVLDDRRVVVVVGDVVGHGMVAAAAMGRLRTAFQAIAPLTADPGAMLQALGRQTDAIPNSFCTTVVCAVIDHVTGTMTWSRAGHPPPLLIDGGGSQLLDERGLPPLGFDPDASPRVHSRDLGVGDTLVLYTDGLIERRGESIGAGLHRLGIVADSLADLDPEEFSDALVEALVPEAEQADDLAVLVVCFDGPPTVPVAESVEGNVALSS